jgi:hypothetical protein
MRATAKALAFAALAMPGAVAAAGPCPVIGAMLAENPKRLKGIGATINVAGTIDVTMNGAADAVRGAENCDLYGPADQLNIACDWSYGADGSAEARRDFDALKGRLEACLPSPLERSEPMVYTEQGLAKAAQDGGASYAEYLRNREVLEEYEQTYELGNEGEHALTVSVNLERDKSDGSMRLRLDMERD